MARISGLERNIAYPEDKTADMAVMTIEQWDEIYKKHRYGLEVNDGRFLTFIDDSYDL